ncbi:MAG: metallophosphoesterase, partial [Candidatus Aegiribacteria sp.]|nr:metallophosphoesterase [Candidatus Aegiribacteria sp.]
IHSASYIEPCMRILAGLTPPSVAVLGNHDHWEDAELTETLLHDLAGSKVLRNRGTWITRGDAKIRIWGVGDLWEDEQLLDGCRPERYNGPVILITHNPDFAEEIPEGTADLVLAGHTHGGQVVLPIIGAPILPSYYGQKYRSGTVWNGKTMVYVSRGIGVGSPPVRLNCRPELAVLELCSAN